MFLCVHCNKEFIGRKGGVNKFCSRKCRDVHTRDDVWRNKQRESHLGHVCDTETKLKMSHSHTRKKHTEEAKIKDKLKHIGKKHSFESRLKMSTAHKGKSPINKGVPCSEKTKDKLKIANIGKKLSFETKQKISLKIKDSWNNTIVAKRRLDGMHSDVARLKSHNSHVGRKQPEYIKQAHRERWQSEEYIEKQRKAIHNKPNKVETKLYNFLDELFPDTYTYTGDFGFMVGGKNPDFTNMDDCKVIDLFGDYYHRGQNPQERIDYFTKYGYKTLVIWEHELKDESTLKTRLLYFQYS